MAPPNARKGKWQEVKNMTFTRVMDMGGKQYKVGICAENMGRKSQPFRWKIYKANYMQLGSVVQRGFLVKK